MLSASEEPLVSPAVWAGGPLPGEWVEITSGTNWQVKSWKDPGAFFGATPLDAKAEYFKTPDEFRVGEYKIASEHGVLLVKQCSNPTDEAGYTLICPFCKSPTHSSDLHTSSIGKIRECNVLSGYNCLICDENELPDDEE